MKQNSLFFYLLLVGTFLVVTSSCEKDEEPLPSMSGTFTFDLPSYCYVEDIFTLQSEANITDPNPEAVSYFWRSNNVKVLKDPENLLEFKDTVSGNSCILEITDSIGTYSVVAFAKADGYNTWSVSKTIVAIDTLTSIGGLKLGERSVVDPRDGIKYYIVKIGALDWFAQNLRYSRDDDAPAGTPIIGSSYLNEAVLADILGRLYTWKEATAGQGSGTGLGKGVQGICPDGWLIPTEDDWVNFGENLNTDAKKVIVYDDLWFGLAEGAVVDATLNGEDIWEYSYQTKRTNVSGWNGIPSGNSLLKGDRFENLFQYGSWWSGTLTGEDDSKASYRYIYYNSSFFAPNSVGQDEFSASVRCVRLAQ